MKRPEIPPAAQHIPGRGKRYRLFQLLKPCPSTSAVSVMDMKAFGSFSARNLFSEMACLGSSSVMRTGRGCFEYPPMPSSLVTPCGG